MRYRRASAPNIKPVGLVKPNRSHPLFDGLKQFFVCNENGGPVRDVVGGYITQEDIGYDGNADPVLHVVDPQEGPVLRTSYTSNFLQYVPLTDLVWFGSTYTLAGRFRYNSISGDPQVWCGPEWNDGGQFIRSTGTGIYHSADGNAKLLAAPDVVIGKMQTHVLRRRGTYCEYWIDGVLQDSDNSYSATSQLGLCYLTGDTNDRFDGDLSWLAGWSGRYLSEDEFSEFTRDPYAVLQRPRITLVSTADVGVTTKFTTDSVAANIGDTTPVVFVLLSAADAVAGALIEARSNSLTTSSGDSLAAAVAETVSAYLQLTRSDGFSLSTVEALDLAVTLAANDQVAMATAEGLVNIASALQLAEALDVTVADAAQTIFSVIVSNDAATASVAEVVNLLVASAANDALDLTLTDAATGIALAVQLVDALDLSVTDAVQSVAVLLVRADSLPLNLSEVIGLLSLLNRGDGVDLSVAEINQLAVLVTALDSLSSSITDAATRQAIGTIIARLTAKLRVYPTLSGKAKVNDE